MNDPYFYALVSTYVPEHTSSLTQLAGGRYINETRNGCTYANGVAHSFNDQYAMIYADGTREWYRYGQEHRDNDLPAVISANGTQWWYQYGKLHRDNGQAAVIFPGGLREWWRNGQRYFRSRNCVIVH